MKNLILLNNDTNIKLGDTGTLMQFKADDNNAPVSLIKGQSATFRIKNEFGFLKSIDADTTMNGYVFQFDTSALDGLVPGTYQLELAVTKSDNDVDIFPDTGFVEFTINENALSITGEQLPVMSLDDFKKQAQTYVNTQINGAETSLESNFQKYVDGIQSNTIDKANKASQDATNAVSTANSANEKAQQAVNTANSMNEKIAANSTLISGNIKQINDLSAKLMPIYTEQTNMLINSTFINFNSWIHGNSATITSDKYNDSNIVQLAPGNGSNYLAQDVKGIDINDSYMVSVYVKGSSDSTLHCEFRGGTKADIQVTSDWKLVTFSGKFSDQSYTRFYMWNSGEADNIFIANPILTQWHMTLDMYNKLAGGGVTA